ncbi:hypothetical protein BOTBODRAFT_55380 [Botryobasidium botryosum FD-172 SS1]|uniref:Uncharacterized protein n=1 Tax=Botryobasidium botryosum (strain FD-172 SS1) TaxID=930990 RepID=A0A067MG84_BOTB1|nr:hypothetical protein BOTBODRAFT_55380 [Botryobasidium botryosum FD-172 SS1]
MARERILPVLVAAAAGVLSGFYIWRQPLEQYTASSAASPLSAQPQLPRAGPSPGSGSPATRGPTEKEA